MPYPATTALYAAALAILFALLSVWVIAGRFDFGVLHQDGGNEKLGRRIRAHSNFAEYVPLTLILAAFLEMGSLNGAILHGLLAPLLVARLLHPIGMVAQVGSMQQYVCRGASAVVTIAVIVVAASMLFWRVVFRSG
jgi:uncharacterized protein